jgi:hypothetical protein
MSDLVKYCQAHKADGTQCKRIPAAGDKWCSYHRKRFASKVTHGLYADPETLGIPRGKHVAFDEFMATDSPYDLRPAIAHLQVILLEQREAIQKSSRVNLDDVRETYQRQVLEDLEAAGMEDSELAAELCEISTNRFVEAVTDAYGETVILGPAHYSILVGTIDVLGKTMERAKKINDGITVNVSFKGVHDAMMKLVTKILQLFPDPHMQMAIVQVIRDMDLLGMGKPRNSMEEIIDAEFTDLDDD